MSTLKVDTIQKADGTGSLSVPAESGTVVTTASPSLGRRNLIINGAMQVAQRGTSWSGLQNSPQYGADRFSYRRSGTWSSASFTLSVEADAPSGFRKSLKLLSSGTQSPSSENATFSYFWEGQDLQQLGYGTADAKTMTLSFWVKSSLTGKISVGFNNDDDSESYYSYVTVNSANTWEYKTVTITGDTANTIANDNTTGMKLNIAVSSGTSEPTLNQWIAGTLRAFGTSGEGYIDIAGTSGASVQITGVQLEVGSVATPFEHRSYGEELALCQRYYQKLGGGSNTPIGMGINNAGNSTRATYIKFHSLMRSAPSLSIEGTIKSSDRISYDADITSIIGSEVGLGSATVGFSHATGGSTRDPEQVAAKNGTTSYLNLDAEL